MAKRQKATKFSIQGFDLAHYKTTEAYTRAVKRLFDRATRDVAESTANMSVDPDKPFSFEDYPKANRCLRTILDNLTKNVTAVIETGSRKQWLYANKKNDGFIASIMDTSKISRARLSKMQDANLDALAAFQRRKVDGMNLSQRVWRYVDQYREQIECALDVGLGEGRSAQQLARDVKENLVCPDKLFRRVRDKRGNLVLSKRAAAFHPGRGVYRSSVKNAQRLTRSEINMAYRESDYRRWQQLDFVVGIEIHRSNHDPLCKCDLCERLTGRYPKTFKFIGWHPQCMCFAVPVLMDDETFNDNELGDLKAALRGTNYQHKATKNAVLDVPEGFSQWVKENAPKQAGWASTPYFIRDNFKSGSLADGLLPRIYVMPGNSQKNAPIVEGFVGKTPQEIRDFILANIADGCDVDIKKGDLDLWNDIVNQLQSRIQQFGLPKFSRIGKPANRQAEASWDGSDNGFNVNIPFLRNKTAIARAEKWKKKGVFYSFAYEDEEDYIRAVIDHEIGHALMAHFGFKSDVIATFGKAGKSIMVDGKPFAEINDVLGYYASTNIDEYFAEAFAFYMGKNRGKLGKETTAMMESFMKRAGVRLNEVSGIQSPKVDPVQEQISALSVQISKAIQDANKWGLGHLSNKLQSAVKAKDVSGVKAAISEIGNECVRVEAMRVKWIAEANALIAECRSLGIDASVLEQAKNNILPEHWGMPATQLMAQKLLDDTRVKIDARKAMLNAPRTKEQLDNETELAKELGVTQGKDMTFDDANKSRGNPNYQPKFIPDPNGMYIIRSTGERFSKNKAYKKMFTINCQSCVVANELRRRGFDVEAQGNKKGSMAEMVSRHTEWAWIDKNGKTPASTKISNVAGAGKAAMIANLETAMSEIGRYHIKWTWKGGRSGHIITCERLPDGSLRYYDPQNGNIIPDFLKYADDFSLVSGIYVLRVDTLRFDVSVTKGIIQKSKKTKKV